MVSDSNATRRCDCEAASERRMTYGSIHTDELLQGRLSVSNECVPSLSFYDCNSVEDQSIIDFMVIVVNGDKW